MTKFRRIQLFRERLSEMSARNHTERYCGWLLIYCRFQEIRKNGTRGHGLMFTSAKGKQQK